MECLVPESVVAEDGCAMRRTSFIHFVNSVVIVDMLASIAAIRSVSCVSGDGDVSVTVEGVSAPLS